MIQLSETQALQLLAYLENSNPANVDDIENYTLITTSDSLMWDIAEQLNIDMNEYKINPITLKIEKVGYKL